MTLDTFGNLGIGVTPSAWSGYKGFDLATNASIGSYLTNITLNSNAYFGASGWAYKSTAAAGQYLISGNVHAWYNAASGTAGNAITFTQAMTLDANGNFGLGVTPSAWYAGSQAIQNSSGAVWQYNGSNIYIGQNYYLNSSLSRIYSTTAAASEYNQSGGAHRWYNAPSGTAGNAITFTQAMTLDSSGRLLVAQTSSYGGVPGSSVLQVSNGTGGSQAATFTTSAGSIYTPICTWNQASTGYLAYFLYGGSNGTNCGSISYNGTLTVYSTTSDRRLKENIIDAGSGIEKISKIKIRSFDWIDSKTNVDFGVVAQEINEVAPECVSIGSDNEDGTMDKPWGVDISVLVPAMIKAIQEQQALITTLQTQVAALQAKVGA
jgi:hypothetical protein